MNATTAMPTSIVIRSAQVHEADALTALCRRSKRHWGYDDTFMARSALSLAVSVDAIAEGRVLVAHGPDPSTVIGMAELSAIAGDVIELDKLFIDPPAIGRGVGAVLFGHAVALARERAARRMVVLADPNAAVFYEKMGARFLRTAPSDAIPGRQLPLYTLDLGPPPRSSAAPHTPPRS
ncbi:GNAT family N-acetyltransferase [Reyranella sp. CPCC 100927]|uniref:GNAT family N-acetyltransferase n=1 Tax=Reyranella sp. CPCC 100927 TaxID=2599616 RepID=UPI0011B75D2D|nr:GNAT family N-acetyltransferase [Reyranella sp. CPCC 100927]TWS95952.1 GNAT family N-acetyltransferase [Reyranella sp. CPCC 100927]